MRVVWTRSALFHLEEIQDHIALDSPSAAHKVAVTLTERPAKLLGQNPMIGRAGRAKGTRELILGDLPYIIVYRITDKVEVLAVVHTARKWPTSFD